jgi:DNA primase
MGFTKDSIERVKDAVDMVELVGSRTELRRAGGRYVGLCPFHDERTPSFSVNVDQKLYHCFGCGEGGDAIGFVQQTEALDFPGAVEFLANRYNVELTREEEDPQAEERRRRRDRLLKLLERATTFYERYLWDAAEAEPARRYLEGRGLGEEVLRDFRIGYAPKAWDRVMLAAQRDGFTEQELAAAGLGRRGRQGGFGDLFRGRIMFPLADARGRVLGFGARAMRDDQRPKYMNTPEGELYHKRRQLFGIDRARAPIAKARQVIVVEGYTDVLALHAGGVAQTVAIMGTALTPEQFSELARAAGQDGTVVLALDADRAGLDAMMRAARAAEEKRIDLMVVELPEGKDPADLVLAGGVEAFTRLLDRAISVPEFQTRRLLAEADLGTPHGRDRALDALRPVLAGVRRPATRDHLVRYVADKLDVPAPSLVTELATARPAAPPAPAQQLPADPGPVAPPATAALDAVARAERSFLAMCVGRGDLGHRYLLRLTDDHLTSAPLREARDWLKAHFDSPLAELESEEPTLAAIVTDVVALGDEEPSNDPVLRLSFFQLELRRIERALRHAERAGDFDLQRRLFEEREGVRGGIAEVMGETA